MHESASCEGGALSLGSGKAGAAGCQFAVPTLASELCSSPLLPCLALPCRLIDLKQIREAYSLVSHLPIHEACPAIGTSRLAHAASPPRLASLAKSFFG